MQLNRCHTAAVLAGLLLIATIAILGEARGVPVGGRVKRQNMEQLKPWMEWGSKYGQIMFTTVMVPAGQEAASIASAGREGGGGEEGGS